jgi:phage host-nuclease inhibitor protein Gam
MVKRKNIQAVEAETQTRLPITTVDQVDTEIREIAHLELKISDLENAMQQKLLEIEKEFGDDIKRLKSEKAVIVDGVLTFAKDHKEIFGGKKSRKFNYGTLALTKEGTKVEFLEEEPIIIANLKRAGFATGVVKQVESIDKNAIEAAVPEDKRKKIGFEMKTTGGEPVLKIDKRSIEILRDAEANQKQQRKAS